jgi:hypothetical protein
MMRSSSRTQGHFICSTVESTTSYLPCGKRTSWRWPRLQKQRHGVGQVSAASWQASSKSSLLCSRPPPLTPPPPSGIGFHPTEPKGQSNRKQTAPGGAKPGAPHHGVLAELTSTLCNKLIMTLESLLEFDSEDSEPQAHAARLLTSHHASQQETHRDSKSMTLVAFHMLYSSVSRREGTALAYGTQATCTCSNSTSCRAICVPVRLQKWSILLARASLLHRGSAVIKAQGRFFSYADLNEHSPFAGPTGGEEGLKNCKMPTFGESDVLEAGAGSKRARTKLKR